MNKKEKKLKKKQFHPLSVRQLPINRSQCWQQLASFFAFIGFGEEASTFSTTVRQIRPFSVPRRRRNKKRLRRKRKRSFYLIQCCIQRMILHTSHPLTGKEKGGSVCTFETRIIIRQVRLKYRCK